MITSSKIFSVTFEFEKVASCKSSKVKAAERYGGICRKSSGSSFSGQRSVNNGRNNGSNAPNALSSLKFLFTTLKREKECNILDYECTINVPHMF